MAGRADDLGTGPAAGGHDLLAVKDILNCVLSLTFCEDGIRRNRLGEGERGHGVRLDKLVVGSGAGEDEMRSDPGFELANAFKSAFTLLGGRRSVRIRRSAENDDGVEVCETGIGGGGNLVNEGGPPNNQEYKRHEGGAGIWEKGNVA